MCSMKDTKEQTPSISSGPSRIKSQHVPAPPDKDPERPRLFACNRVEFQKKDGEYERKQAIRQLYTSRGIVGKHLRDEVQFITKVQIKKTKTPIPPSSSERTQADDAHTEDINVEENEPEKRMDSTSVFEPQSPSKSKNVDLLWSENSTDDHTDVMRLVRTLSRRLNQNRLLLQRSRQDRPTASFAAPTKGEINLLLKSPEAKKAIEAKRCKGHQILLFNRGRALSLPVSNYFSVDKKPFRIPMGVVRPSTGRVEVERQNNCNNDNKLCSTCKQRTSVH